LTKNQKYLTIYTTKTVALTGGDYTTLTSAFAAITDASIAKSYVLNLKNGTYNESNIVTKNYIDAIGESRDGIIIRADGLLQTGLTSVIQAGLFAETISNFKNLTIDTNDTKYCVHNDNLTTPYEAKFYNCKFIHRGCVDHA